MGGNDFFNIVLFMRRLESFKELFKVICLVNGDFEFESDIIGFLFYMVFLLC